MDTHLTDVVGIEELASVAVTVPRSTASGVLPSKIEAVHITSK
ncbi:MAG: hypothetical protein WA869_03520 [Alloacidobacterium sp.]